MFSSLMTINATPATLAIRKFVTWLYLLYKWHYTICSVTYLLVTFSHFSFQFLPCLYSVDDCASLPHAPKLEDESSRIGNTTKLSAFFFFHSNRESGNCAEEAMYVSHSNDYNNLSQAYAYAASYHCWHRSYSIHPFFK